MHLAAGSGILLTSLLLALIPPGSALAAPGDLLTTSRTNVNVRTNPTTEAPIVVTIDPGETIIESERRDGWYRVRLPDRNRDGWIYGPLLEPVVDLPSPAVEPAGSAAAAPGGGTQFPRLSAFDDRLTGDPAKGEAVFYKCGSCHTTVRGVHAQGPSLVGVFGRPPALAAGYGYSGAMQAFARDGAVWDEATLDRFIQRPAHVVKGTSMPFSGVRDPQDRRDLIAYLQQLAN